MAGIRSNEDPTVRNAKLLAKLYYYMAKEMVDQLGEEKGKAAVRHAIEAFGKDRAASMLEEAKERGITIKTMDDYGSVKDMPLIGWKGSDDPPGVIFCPFHEIWQQYGASGIDLGRLYCEVDFTLIEGVGLSLKRTNCLTHGDEYCDFIVEGSDETKD